jgi:hypothetical protein
MVGICAGRPSTWIFPSGSTPAIAICSWFVDPAHFGKGIGKRMVKQLSAPGRFLYTFVISEAAIANFQRLGWVGPYVAPMLARPLPGLLHFLLGATRGSSSGTSRSMGAISQQPLAPLSIVSNGTERQNHASICVAIPKNYLGGSL